MEALCESILSQKTEAEAILVMLVFADKHSVTKLKDFCVEFLVENCQKVVRIPGWKEKLKGYPSLLAELFEAVIEEPQAKRRRLE